MKQISVGLFVLLSATTRVNNAYSADKYWFGPIPYETAIEKARKIIGKSFEEYQKDTHHFITYKDIVGGYNSKVVYRFGEKGTADAVFVHLDKASVSTPDGCWKRFDEVYVQLRSKYGQSDSPPNIYSPLSTGEMKIKNATFSQSKNKIEVQGHFIMNNCHISVAYTKNTAGGSQF